MRSRLDNSDEVLEFEDRGEQSVKEGWAARFRAMKASRKGKKA